MLKMSKQKCTLEFKERAVQHVNGNQGGHRRRFQGSGIGRAHAVQYWRKAAKAEKLNSAGGKTLIPEQMGLSRARVENA